MGLRGMYNALAPEGVGISIIKEAFNQEITFFDTSDAYGPHTNEILMGKALKQLPREKIQLATKFGIARIDSDPKIATFCGSPEYVRACCEASLKRLDVEYIDLYCQHRIDTSVPIEDTMGDLKKLVEKGKIKELGIGIVPYSPLGQGFLAGKAVVESLASATVLRFLPRFTGENLEQNKVFYTRVENLAKKYGGTPAQLALTWVLNQGDDVVPIPGTTKIKNLDNNIGALRIKLTKDEFKEVSDAVPADEVAGLRTRNIRHTWKFGNTPPRDGQVST
ncbi:hypothetical protein GH714_002746 [Hevea brasiliensis]|uniref:NADP-dependent oxidoreductase domain-containing protein n=1 Tax=Hevea brasiliensis TaxID=3981 RepID=A0A6A6KHA9_HEVBR|nr:hypothetical protein GH714_002746 [Hevea brasiliensis]